MKCLLVDVNSIIPYYVKGSVNGVGRSTLELLKALAKIPGLPFEIILFSQNVRGVKAKKYFPFRYLHFYIPYRPFFKRVVNIFRLKRCFCHYDLIHIPHNIDPTENESKVIYTVHDLMVWYYPEMWEETKDSHFFHRLKKSLLNCKAIVTCSESSKKDIVLFSGVDEQKVTVIPWGVDRETFYPMNEGEFLKRLNIDGLYYFSASCNHPRKNLSLLLASYQIYLRNGGIGQLVLLNPLDDNLANYQDLIDKNKIIVCRNISDDELAQLYTFAHCSIIVSMYEGFGLPVLESLACHTMVLSAKNSSLTEAGGNIVDYFDNLDEISVSVKMLEYDKKSKLDMLDSVTVEKHLRLFTWENCAKHYVDFYRRQLNNKS